MLQDAALITLKVNFFFSSRRRHTRCLSDWSSDVCSSDLNVLREFGLPREALGWSLFSFNVGVEIGQLFIVLLVATALALLRRRNEVMGTRVAFAGSIVVIAAGTYWFVQRVFFSV